MTNKKVIIMEMTELRKALENLESSLKKARPTKFIRKIPKPGGGWKYIYKEDVKKEKKAEAENKESNIDIDNEKTLKNNVKIIEGKKYNKKQIVNDNGYKFITYNYIPKKIEFKSPMVNDMNQNLSGGWTIQSFRDEDKLSLDRVLQGKKPMSSIGFFNEKDKDEFIQENNIDKIDKNKFNVLIQEKRITISKKGKIGEMFDLEKLKKDYADNGIGINIEKVKNKDIVEYLRDWDFQDRSGKVNPWETGLILGYPIENTISLYKGGIRG
jgi:hypothetical protein